MKTFALVIFALLVACARAPGEISRDLERQVLEHGEDFASDPRASGWCSDPRSRRRIIDHCVAREVAEARRQAGEQYEDKRATKERAAAEEEAKVRARVRKTAQTAGYTVDFETGLTMTIVGVRRGEKRLNDLRSIAISLVGDSGFVALQVIDQNNVLFKDSSTDALVWLHDYGRRGGEVTWLVGAELTSMEWGYIAIRGTKEYRTAFGTAQAVVIEPVF